VASRPARVFFNGEKGDSNGYQSMSKSIMQNDKNGHQSVDRRWWSLNHESRDK
jgi:hypothetical protein